MKRIHYGWFVCLGCALLLFCTSGLSVNAFTVYQPYILQENGFTNAQSSTIITVRSLFSFLATLLTFLYYKRLSLRVGMTLAGGLTVFGFLLLGLAGGYGLYCLAAACVGLGFGLGAMIPIAIVLEHWFIRRRSFAVGLCSAFTGLSTLGIPSALTGMIERWGLKNTFLAEAAAIALLVSISFLLIRDYPSQKGMTPYEDGPSRAPSLPGCSGVVLTKKHWFLLWPTLLMLGAMTSVGYSHLAVLATSEGFGSHAAALAITVSGVMLTVSKCAYGWISDRIGSYRSNWIFGSVLTLGLVLCCVMNGSILLLFAAMCAYGIGLAATTVGLTTWAGDLSTPERYDDTVRRFQIGYAAGTLVFSSLPGILADRFGGSYIPAYAFFVFCTVFVILAIQYIYRQTGAAGK